MRCRLAIVALLAVSAPPFAQAQTAKTPLRTAGDRPVDVRHLKLELDVDLKGRKISGTATLELTTLRPLSTIRLDAVDHQVSRIRGAIGKGPLVELAFDNTGRELQVHLSDTSEKAPAGQAWRLEIDYTVANPPSGLHFFGPSKSAPDQPLMVWSHGEPISNRYWFPSQDHPAERQSSEIIATVPAGNECLSNGRLVSRKKQPDGRVRFHWRQEKPHVSYLITLVVGEFTVTRKEWRGRPVLFYVPPGRAADTERTFGRTVEMLDFFSDRFGIVYPWEKYAQVVVEQFTAGGMENTSATTLYSGTMHDARAMLDSSPDRLIAHELGHQWWGDLVTCRDWSHLWLNEGFATYSEVLWWEHKLGRDEADYLLYSKSRSGRGASALARPIVDRHYAAPRSMFDSRAYPKAAWVLHMLRHRVGDDAFFRALKRWGTVYAYQTAETSDLRKTFERLLGHSLERFFYDWTERPGHPVLSVASSYQPGKKLMRVAITQEQKGEPFHFPLSIEFVVPGRSEPVTLDVDVTSKEQVVFVPVPARPSQVRVDPRFTVLAELKEKKSHGLWRTQLEQGATVPERLRAVEYFRGRQTPADRKQLVKSLEKDRFYGVRIAAAAALGRAAGGSAGDPARDTARDALLKGLGQDHPKVRKACVDALAGFRRDRTVAAALKKKWAAGDKSYQVEAAVLRSLARVETQGLKTLTAALKKDSHRDVIRQAALAAIGRIKDPAVIDLLLEWTTPDRTRRCRLAAIGGLAERITRFDTPERQTRRVVEALTRLLKVSGPRIRHGAVSALRRLGSSARTAADAVASLAEHDPEGRVRAVAADALEALKKAPTASAELARLRSELETLRKRNKDLAERLGKLEAK